MQTVRGHFNGTAIELLEEAPSNEHSYVLITFLEGSLETAAARAERKRVSVAMYSLGKYNEPFRRPKSTAPSPIPERHAPFTVGEIMTRRIVAVSPDSTVASAVHTMHQNGITSILVEPDQSGEWGIMTMRDVLKKIVSVDRSTNDTLVSELVTRPLIYVTPDSTLRDCSQLMVDKNIRRLVIREGEQPVGIVSDTDIFQIVEERGWAPPRALGEDDHG